MTDERPDALSDDELGAIEAEWTAPEPPVTFAKAVLDAHFAQTTEEAPAKAEASGRSRTTWIWIAALAGLVVGVLAWGLRPGSAVEDELAATRIETVALGDRGTAVAQPGASLSWSVDSDGAARIDQSSGRVFYRVDDGERFDVVTPVGTVTVTGTCFEVDLEPKPMKNSVRAGALGAALASALVVTVYEGGVVLANEHGSVDIDAGQAARIADTSAPIRFNPDDPERSAGALAMAERPSSKPGQLAGDPLAHINRQARDIERIRGEKDAQAARIRELEQQVVDLGGSVDPETPEGKKARAKACANQSRGGSCPFLEPDQETLLEMARCATVKIDSLGFVSDPEPPPPGRIAERLGITDAQESKKLDAAAQAQYDDYNEKMRAMYLELGGSEEAADGASGKTLQSFIFDQLDNGLLGDVQRQIAEERAGLRDPPTDVTSLPIEQRVARLMAEDGNDFERLVADQLGAERARELRRKDDGWPGSTSVHSGDCRE